MLSTYPSRELLITNLDNNINQKKFPYETSLDRTFCYLYAHFQEELTLEKVAAYSNLNASTLCRSFKRACGCTIFQFINRLRIEKACRLLRDTDLNFAQVAYQVGFNSIAHFNNQFKRVVHTLPSVYRRS